MTGGTSLSNILVFLQRACEKKHTQKKNIYYSILDYVGSTSNIHQILYNGSVDPFVNFVTVFVLLLNVIFYGYHNVKNKYKIHTCYHGRLRSCCLRVSVCIIVNSG